MPLRLASAAIVLFWLATTTWLIRSVWFSDRAGLEPVSKEEALGAFFRWNDTTNLSILENGVKIGQLAVSGLEGVDPRTGAFSRGLSTSGTLDEPGLESGESAELSGVSWRLNADFSDSSDLKGFQAAIRVPGQNLTIRIEMAGEPPIIAARAMMGGLVIYESGRLSVDESEDVEPSGEAGKRTDSASPLPALALSLMSEGGGLPGDVTAFQPKIEAGRGVMSGLARGLPVYVIEATFGQDAGFAPVRLFLSEAGEPLRIETEWGYEAVAEVLIPVESTIR